MSSPAITLGKGAGLDVMHTPLPTTARLYCLGQGTRLVSGKVVGKWTLAPS